VQVKEMLHTAGEAVANYEQNMDRKMLGPELSENEAKSTCCYMLHSSPVNLFMTENTNIAFLCLGL
jgi:hypothetical protein